MSYYYRIAILDMNAGEPNEGMRCIKMLTGEFLAETGIKGSYDVFDVRIENQIPNLEDYDIFISSGGPGSPFPDNEPWEKPYSKFLDELYNHNLLEKNKKFLFLICHSFQLACLHWKVGKTTRRKSTAFGIMAVFKNKKGKKEPYLKGLPNPFYAVDSRDYQVIDTNKKNLKRLGFKVVCREKKRPHVPLPRAVMAIRFSNEIFGTQFHPEADAEGMLRYFNREDKKQHIIKNHGRKKYFNMLERLDDHDKIMLTEKTIIPNFLRDAAKTLQKDNLVIV